MEGLFSELQGQSARARRWRSVSRRRSQTGSHSRGMATIPFARKLARTNVWKLGLKSWSSMNRPAGQANVVEEVVGRLADRPQEGEFVHAGLGRVPSGEVLSRLHRALGIFGNEVVEQESPRRGLLGVADPPGVARGHHEVGPQPTERFGGPDPGDGLRRGGLHEGHRVEARGTLDRRYVDGPVHRGSDHLAERLEPAGKDLALLQRLVAPRAPLHERGAARGGSILMPA